MPDSQLPAATIIEGGVIVAPHGTVSMHLDLEAGCLRVFSEREPDPEDWEMAVKFIRKAGGPVGYEWGGASVDAFTVEIAPDSGSCLHGRTLRHCRCRLAAV